MTVLREQRYGFDCRKMDRFFLIAQSVDFNFNNDVYRPDEVKQLNVLQARKTAT